MNYSNRILIVDDNESIHKDITKILNSPRAKLNNRELDKMESELFEDTALSPEQQDTMQKIAEMTYRIDSAYQGKDAIKMVNDAQASNDPYAMVFMDVRMPPGIDGIETIVRIWRDHPNIQMVVVTAYSDYSWEDILRHVGTTDRLMVLRKPFDQITVKQLALALTKKYNLSMKVKAYLQHIENEIEDHNHQLYSMVKELKEISSLP